MTIATKIFNITFIDVLYLKNFTCSKICNLTSEFLFFIYKNSIHIKPDYVTGYITN